LSKQTVFRHGTNLPRVRSEVLNAQRLATLNWNHLLNVCIAGTYGAFLTELQRNTIDGYIEEWNPAFLSTKANAEDHPDFDTVMNGPHAAGFWKACQIEWDMLLSKDVWEIVSRPLNRHVISGTWALRIKRFPDGTMRKLKARFCARGFEQTEGVDYDETYAPVVNWTTVRFLLMMSILLGLETRQVDYVAAFVQADIDMDVYVEMPRGFAQPGKVLKLMKSLYGLRQSPRNYFNHLSAKLTKLGFVPSDADPCLFVSDKCICLVYVDDTLFFARSQTDIDEIVQGLRNLNMDLEEESDVAGFLGVLIDRRPDGSIALLQQGLIARIIDALHISDLHPKRTPSALGVLAADKDGDPPNGTFNYASVVGMLGYLQANSRPDLTFAVAQCARFTHSPKRSHELALMRIGQYLKGTADKGLIFRPKPLSTIFETDVYVDSDFAGGWGYEDPNDPACVKSRTGFIIEIMGCPIQWLSKLQPNIATSTMEAEYTALSIALRAAIPLIQIIKFVNSAFKLTQNAIVTFKTTVHEDNLGALTLAKLDPGRQTPRSKFYAIKMHWFRSWLKPNEIELQHVDTALQKADMFTKSLPTASFEQNRFLTCGW
jgi:Reverse transcriptase (RNA-dependent DNA polymerase)